MVQMIDTKAVRALADKQANVWTPIGWEADVANMLRQCADRIDALEDDAARYRWLQSNVDGVSWCVTHDGNTGSSDWLVGPELDDAIDRARKGTT